VNSSRWFPFGFPWFELTFYSTFNFKSKMSRDLKKTTTRVNVNRHLHFLLKRHIIVTCLVVRVTPISSTSIDVGCFLLLHRSHYISNSKPCVCQMSKTCKDIVRNTHTHTHNNNNNNNNNNSQLC
jgi:hypothetical protein